MINPHFLPSKLITLLHCSDTSKVMCSFSLVPLILLHCSLALWHIQGNVLFLSCPPRHMSSILSTPPIPQFCLNFLSNYVHWHLLPIFVFNLQINHLLWGSSLHCSFTTTRDRSVASGSVYILWREMYYSRVWGTVICSSVLCGHSVDVRCVNKYTFVL